jgi:hypothetical protein
VWLQMVAVKEKWQAGSIPMWQKKLQQLGVTHVDFTHYPDHSEIDLDSEVWEVLDPTAAQPFSNALGTAAKRMERLVFGDQTRTVRAAN